VASAIANVSLVMVRADMPLAYLDAATEAVLSFLSEEPAAGQGSAPTAEALQVLLFISVAAPGPGYESIMREMVRSRGATSFGAVAGGYSAAFRSAQMALETAGDLQQAFTAQGDPAGLRIGGDAVDRTSGEADQLAESSRRAGQVALTAAGGEVLVTDVVRQLVTGKGFLFAARTPGLYEGSDEPVAIYELRWRA
jgi:hypothetical protein